MSALRLSSSFRVAARQASIARVARRGYADVADDKLKLSLVSPSQAVTQVNIPAATGDMGILSNHVPSIEALRPGVVEVIEEGGKTGKYFGTAQGRLLSHHWSGRQLHVAQQIPTGFATTSSITRLSIAATWSRGCRAAMECDERSPTSPWRCHIHDLGAFTLTSVSTGFATVHPNNTLTINAVEAYPIDKFSADAVRNGISEAQKVIGSSASEQEKAEARIELEVFEAINAALGKSA
ncbi:hypothetical protein A1Q2_01969 [Trichosporon asahii var. asahii CBS 8904]|uniref:ATP synthase subunit delta, mitochondrial n=2 Tax=Trichosporon asahii var. asahii TaxID=189963 RepID=K1W4F5_TRIAC|nr:hypothetical protein A1Q1_04258 [Trichosporon asahii var. asahii CBS 2479]EJT47015.1 hypothetical protein A1Q1_04258 [Trichosporon asahii var. asahii CBS 2479]EKD03743.1 hypothetical protein A1Q2_01969 [Trichosporon asahii var. asahii CBS 8904]